MPDQSNDYPSENQSDAGRSAKAKKELEKQKNKCLRILCCSVVSFEIISLNSKIWVFENSFPDQYQAYDQDQA